MNTIKYDTQLKNMMSGGYEEKILMTLDGDYLIENVVYPLDIADVFGKHPQKRLINLL